MFPILGELQHIGNLRPWNLFSVLTQKYNWRSKKARDFADFLEPMLEYDRRRRATAWECLNHKWINEERERRMSNSSSSSDTKKHENSHENFARNGKESSSSNRTTKKEEANQEEEDGEEGTLED